jgi:hypothetical protein
VICAILPIPFQATIKIKVTNIASDASDKLADATCIAAVEYAVFALAVGI